MHTFSGKWITSAEFADVRRKGGEDACPQGEKDRKAESLLSSHILFRTRFHWNGRGRVGLYFSADDCCKVYVNGVFVTQGPAPCYTGHTYYVRREIAGFLHPGENLLAFHTYYQGLVNRVWVSGDLCHGLLFDVTGRAGLLACSDERVLCARHTGYSISHKTGYDTQFLENYDSRAAEVGFERPDFDDAGWGYARYRTDADYVLYPQPSRQLVFERLVPIRRKTPTGEMCDFLQEFVGNPLLKARGEPGDRVEIRLAEETEADGSARYRMRCNCEYREVWTLSGGEDEFLPFDYKAFRYMELLYPSSVKITLAAGQARHYPFRLRRGCRSADEDLRRIFGLCVNTLRYGLQEGYLDCPSREKGQYFGDGAWSALAHVYLTGDRTLCKKFIENAFESTAVDAGMTAQGPCAFVQTIAEFPLFVVILLKGYLYLTGDAAFVGRQKEKVISLLRVYRDRYYDRERRLIDVYDRWNVVDWPASARDGYDFPLEQNRIIHGFHNVMNGYYLYAVRVCRELYGEEIVDVAAFGRAYEEAFHDPASHLFRDSVHSAHTALASQLFGVFLGFGGEREEENLLRMVEEKRLSCSNLFVTPILFLWLYRTGREELLFDLIGDPGAWLNMLAEGATTTFEAFSKEKKVNASLFHTMFAFPVLFLGEGDAFEKNRSSAESAAGQRDARGDRMNNEEDSKMKKEITAVCLAASMMASLCACSGDPGKEHIASDATVDTFLGEGEYIAFGDLAYDPTDEDVLQTYLDCGFNVFVIHEDYTGAITDGVSNNGGLTDKYKARLQALTDKGVNTWIRNQYNDPDYVENDDADRDRFNYSKDYKLPVRDLGPDDFDPYSVSGFFLCDEPSMYEYKSGKRWWHAMSEYEKLVDWYNKYYTDSGKFFHMNLFPSYAQNVYFTNSADPTEYCTYEEYVDYYVENFAKKINGPKSICVDNYPYKDTGEIRSGFYENLLLFANKTRECNAEIENEAYKAKFGICIQAFTESGLCDIVCAEDISFQILVGAAMGAELFHYYCYATLGIDRTKGIMTTANTKRIYDYVQQANREYLPFAKLTTGFDWIGMTAVEATNEADRENSSFNGLAGAISMEEMGDLKGVTSTRDALVGYFTHKESGQPGYMVVNCSLPSAQRSSGVVLDFGSHERVLVYTASEDGVTPAGQEMQTIGGKLRLTVGAGEGVFVVPV